ncbi:mitoferrin-2 [Histoplasma capsulatum var. duboisii H88]|uniref:Mitoferrin n=1 Tax=Ajellomyces capsulatus (strain H88) TaxID=544711 RepID=F0UJB1_AJEC8|nr:mitoferrin-2 [Histoplasma capsulatum var. duboisii H88]QSS57177.1 mitoferrin [Histoplasma capsulatum var. duboisii H88]
MNLNSTTTTTTTTTTSWNPMPGLFSSSSTTNSMTSTSSPSTAIAIPTPTPTPTATATLQPSAVYGNGNWDPNRAHATMTTEFGGERRSKRARIMGDNDGVDARARMLHEEVDVEAARPPYIHSMLAGGIGGTSGDLLMHSLDTVKTRQQGDPHVPPKYTSMSSSYATILRQEGIRRGLYSGVTPALLGSFPGTVIFFGTYEYSKRHMLDAGVNPSLSYLAGGFIADLAASVVYVPSEVLKTRQQLQGRYNNPFFRSGYNYRGTIDAFRTIIRQEGFGTLFSGYKATLFRDLPFSALQFAFYEQEQKLAKKWVGSRDIGLPLEILTATTAGGMAGVITCPLDVVKTRTQTQQSPDAFSTSVPRATSAVAAATTAPAGPSTTGKHQMKIKETAPKTVQSTRLISTSSPSTSTVKPGAPILDTSSVFTGLKLIYRTEGILGWFRGVGPRFLWTSVQSGTMLVLYQYLLKQLDSHQQRHEGELGDGGGAVL